jgi:hypothetical protein
MDWTRLSSIYELVVRENNNISWRRLWASYNTKLPLEVQLLYPESRLQGDGQSR